jgi:hypothetical protein
MSEPTGAPRTTEKPITANAQRHARRMRGPRVERPDPTPGLDDSADAIDYAPAMAAIGNLFGWAFGLAEKDVAGWPEGTRRVRKARRYVSAVLSGRHPRNEPREELLFTAALMVCIFDADLGLGLADIAEILDELTLPNDHAPIAAHPRSAAPTAPRIPPAVWRHLRAVYAALSPVQAEQVRGIAARLSPAQRDAWIRTLAPLSVEQAAAVVLAHLRGEIALPVAQPGRAPTPQARRSLVVACAACGDPRTALRVVSE